MKKILFLAILISQITFVFGQDNYGSWVSSKCYNYIQTKMKYNGKSSVQRGNQRIEQGWYTISFKNNSSKKIELWCIASSTSKSASKSDNPIDRVTLNPNETYSNDYYFDNYQQNLLYIEIWRVTVINTDGSANKYYEKCSDGTPCTECIIRPIQTPCGDNSGSNSNTSNTQQNDLTEYNNSKADLERQIQEKNAQGQQKSQNYTTAMNAGISAYNSGNYSEAKKQFSIASNNYNTEEARVKAQEYYKKSVDAQKQTETINQVGTTITNAATLIDDAIAQAKAQKKANKLAYNDLDDHELFEALITDVLIQFKKFGYNPTTPLTEIFSESNFKKYNSTRIEFKDFSILIAWFYHEGSGESKRLHLTCNNETTSNDIKNNKILNKISCGKKSKITYIQTSNSKNKYELMHSIDDIDFTRNTVDNLNELIIKTKEYKLKVDLINKQIEKEKLKEIADAQKEISDAGAEIPIETGKIVNESVTVKSIINNYITATGGSENINAVETITQIDDHNGNYRKTIKGYGKFLQEVTYKDRQYKFVFNGINGYSGNNGEKNPLSQENIIRYQKYQPFDILGLEQSTLRVGKIETIKGVDYYTIIEPSYQSGSLTVIKTNYFAVKSGLWKGFKLDFSSSNNNSSSYIFYNDFREVNHIVLPFSVISFDSYDKKSIDKTIVKEIIINEPNVSFE